MGTGERCPGCTLILGDVHESQPGPGDSGGESAVTISAGLRLRVAFLLAIVADALQLAVIPLFIEGAESPATDIVDVAMAAAMFFLLGWHWEFLPSFAAKLGSRHGPGSAVDPRRRQRLTAKPGAP